MTATHTPAPAGTVITASGSTAGIAVPTAIADYMSVEVVVTAVSGTSPSAQFKVQWSDDGVNYVDPSPADNIGAAQTAVGGAVGAFVIKGAFYRIAYTVSGTSPSFTVKILAYHQ